MYRSNDLPSHNKTTTQYLFIDTSQANDIGNRVAMDANEPGKMKFRIKFNETTHTSYGTMAASLTPGVVYKNIKSVELAGVSFNQLFNDTVGYKAPEYIIIDIEELNGRLHSNSQHVNGVFAVLYLEDGKAYHKGRDFFDKVKIFDPPLSSLSGMNVRIFGPDNRLINIPTDASMTFMFKITTNM
jgi:hypothetical protein